MELDDREESQNVEDRRGFNKKAGIAIGGVGGLLIVILGLVLGVDPQKLLSGLQGDPQGLQDDQPSRERDPKEEKLAHFAKVVFGDTERVWDKQFEKMGKRYPKPTLVLFTGQVDSACGSADTAVGPFYCPGDSKVYIDLSFYELMEKKLKAGGDFAKAYVIAHEVGHHVQRLLGYSKAVDQARKTKSKTEYNKMSVRLELQADYLAGVWAYHAEKQFKKFLDPGDLESALNAAQKIGDDYLQKQATGRVMPEKFTHGKSEQRMRWFKQGFTTGSVSDARKLFDLDYEDL
jgi:predicted metalloprotease